MSRQSTHIYRGFVRSKIKEPLVKERQLTPEKILSLRYQCAIENKDFKMAESLKAIIDSHDEPKVGVSQKNDVSDARKKAEQFFRKNG